MLNNVSFFFKILHIKSSTHTIDFFSALSDISVQQIHQSNMQSIKNFSFILSFENYKFGYV